MSEPLAYLITFRTYGSWLPGDARGSIDRTHNISGTPLCPPCVRREDVARSRCDQAAVWLDAAQRRVVEAAVRQVCRYRDWTLHGANVRTNHVHVVVAAPDPPEHVMNAFKSRATRALRDRGLFAMDQRPWSRHGSTRYLWTTDQLRAACEYASDEQGVDLA